VDRLFNFGVSTAYASGVVNGVEAVADISLYSAIQVPGKNIDRFLQSNISMGSVDVCDLFTLSLTRGVADQTQRIVDGFVVQFSAFIDDVKLNSVNSFTVDFDLGSCIGDEVREARWVEFLKRLAPKLYGKGKKVCIPVRIPYVGDESAQFFYSFLEKVMSSDFQFCVDIHPHELDRGFSVERLLKWFQFDIHSVRFIYEPEAGNQLVKAQLKPWLDFLKSRCFTGDVFIAPVISDDSFFVKEIGAVSALLEGMS